MYRRKKGGRYNKTVVEVDNIKFDSKIEAARYSQLRILEKAGEIKQLELQPKFIIQQNCKIKLNDKVKTQLMIKYIADFKYIENGKIIVEDVKSKYTSSDAQYKIKRKMLVYQQDQHGFDVFREYIYINKHTQEIKDYARCM